MIVYCVQCKLACNLFLLYFIIRKRNVLISRLNINKSAHNLIGTHPSYVDKNLILLPEKLEIYFSVIVTVYGRWPVSLYNDFSNIFVWSREPNIYHKNESNESINKLSLPLLNRGMQHSVFDIIFNSALLFQKFLYVEINQLNWIQFVRRIVNN